MYSFECRTGRVSIDHSKCDGCATFACVEACRLYGSGILGVQGDKPMLTVAPEYAKRRCTECLACELDCYSRGQQAITISLPLAGLEEFRRAVNGHSAG